MTSLVQFLLQAACEVFRCSLAGAPPAFLPQYLHSLCFILEHCVPQLPATICPLFTVHGHVCCAEENIEPLAKFMLVRVTLVFPFSSTPGFTCPCEWAEL